MSETEKSFKERVLERVFKAREKVLDDLIFLHYNSFPTMAQEIYQAKTREACKIEKVELILHLASIEHAVTDLPHYREKVEEFYESIFWLMHRLDQRY